MTFLCALVLFVLPWGLRVLPLEVEHMSRIADEGVSEGVSVSVSEYVLYH